LYLCPLQLFCTYFIKSCKKNMNISTERTSMQCNSPEKAYFRAGQLVTPPPENPVYQLVTAF
jgi:hypothetical protein